MSLFMQALLVAIFVTIAFIDAHTTQIHIFRQSLSDLWLADHGGCSDWFSGRRDCGTDVPCSYFVGTAVPPNPTISTAIATGIAILAGGGTDIAVATALRFLLLEQVAETVQNSVINVFFMHG